MSKLFKLKEWLTLKEAAKHLSTALGEEVAIADIYRLALDGHLVLSMNFPNTVQVNLGRVVSLADAKKVTIPFGSLLRRNFENLENQHLTEVMVLGVLIGDNQVLEWDPARVITIDGTWDLMMIAGERIDVEAMYQSLTNGPNIELMNIDGVFLTRSGEYCRLVELLDGNRNSTLPVWDRYYPIGALPDDGVYVVRISAIMNFLAQINEPCLAEKPLSTKERNSMLTLIAALCKQANIDRTKRGIATALAASTEEIDAPLTDDTIRKILKQVSELID